MSEWVYAGVLLLYGWRLDFLAHGLYTLLFVPLEWLEDGGWDAIPHMLGFHADWCGPKGGHCIMTGRRKS